MRGEKEGEERNVGRGNKCCDDLKLKMTYKMYYTTCTTAIKGTPSILCAF